MENTKKSSLNKFIEQNWRGLLGLFVYIAVGYAGYKELQNEVSTTKRRMQTYINVIKLQGKELHYQDKRITVLETLLKDCKDK